VYVDRDSKSACKCKDAPHLFIASKLKPSAYDLETQWYVQQKMLYNLLYEYVLYEVINKYIWKSLVPNIVNNFIKFLFYSNGQFCEYL
jgi:hypothetical protein